MRTGYEMGLGMAGCCGSGVARQFAPLPKAISSLGALTGFHLQVYRSLHQEGEGFQDGFC
jgi:hypothetical protein